MDNVKPEKPLTPEEEKEFREGMALYEMSQSEGFRILRQKLEDMAFHTWVDPRDIENNPDSEREWKWRELNAFYASNNAKELIEWINKAVSDAQYLEKIRNGELERKAFKF